MAGIVKMKIGIDPGVSGALALLADDNSALIDIADMPVMALGKTKRQVNAAELAKILAKWNESFLVSVAYLEQVSAFPGQGVTAMFNFGVSYGVVQGVLGALQVPVVLVTPQAWKRRASLIGKPKDMCRTLAQRLYPSADLARKKDIGRAEAILIARFGL